MKKVLKKLGNVAVVMKTCRSKRCRRYRNRWRRR
jgi:hypothetical protein